MFGFNINFGNNVGGHFEIFDCVIDIEINDNKQSSRIHAPRLAIEQQFMSMCQEIAQIHDKARIRLSRVVQCYDLWSNNIVEREIYILFENDACVEKENENN